MLLDLRVASSAHFKIPGISKAYVDCSGLISLPVSAEID